MSNKKNILVTGSSGQLGLELQTHAKDYLNCNFFFRDRERLPINESQAIENFLSANKINCCINCAAYTAVDKAESEQEKAYAINSTAACDLAASCNKYGVNLIHFSTDYVFDGKGTRPYTENDITNPLGVYGASKLAGEKAVLENHAKAIIIRTSWLYSSYGNNFVKTMLRLLFTKENIPVVNDQYGSPTYAADLARVILKIMSENEIFTGGVYHYCNAGVITWYEFALAIKELTKSKCIINPVSTADYFVIAKRPAYSALNTTKIQKAFNIDINPWKESLENCIHLLNGKA